MSIILQTISEQSGSTMDSEEAEEIINTQLISFLRMLPVKGFSISTMASSVAQEIIDRNLQQFLQNHTAQMFSISTMASAEAEVIINQNFSQLLQNPPTHRASISTMASADVEEIINQSSIFSDNRFDSVHTVVPEEENPPSITSNKEMTNQNFTDTSNLRLDSVETVISLEDLLDTESTKTKTERSLEYQYNNLFTGVKHLT